MPKALKDLIEAVADKDDELGEMFLEEKTPTAVAAYARYPQAYDLEPVHPRRPGSAFKNKGVQLLLDCVVDYLPSPIDVPPIEGTTGQPRGKVPTPVATTSAARRSCVQALD